MSGGRLCALFGHEPLIAEACALKEAFRASTTPQTAPRPSVASTTSSARRRAQLPAFTAFADGVRLWRSQLLAYFDEPTTNGYAEGVMEKVKLIKRRTYGLPSLEGFRERVPPACS